MEEGGMTDYQFRCYLRKLVHILDDILEKESKEELLAAVEKFKDELKADLEL